MNSEMPNTIAIPIIAVLLLGLVAEIVWLYWPNRKKKRNE